MHKYVAASRHHDRVLVGDRMGERDRPCRRQGPHGTEVLSHREHDAHSRRHRGDGVEPVVE